ncbi:unnamed protein product [Arabis nemorensis]|uniref:Uncharacterized protein n=1 Tax=Arabis nemorensis TaxID=586526 RepID=A0A565AWW8_9BRAS|nr:unnamed protein product [Arabis nemorensis]
MWALQVSAGPGRASPFDIQLLAAFNNTVSAYQTRLQAAPTSTELTEANATITTLKFELAELHDAETKNVEALRLGDERFIRAKSLERKLKEVEATRDEHWEKLNFARETISLLTENEELAKAQLAKVERKYKVLADTRELDLKTTTREARKDLAIKFKTTLDLVKSHIAGKNAMLEPFVKISEMKANVELLEVIIKGEFTDFQAELDVVSLDKQDKYAKDLAEAEVRVLKLDMSQMKLLTSDLS